MKVNNDPKTNLLDSLTKSAQVKTAKDAVTEGKVAGDTTDKVELSSKQEEIARITEKVKAAPEVNEEKVEQIKNAISDGTYNVKGEMVAKSMLKSQFLDQVL